MACLLYVLPMRPLILFVVDSSHLDEVVRQQLVWGESEDVEDEVARPFNCMLQLALLRACRRPSMPAPETAAERQLHVATAYLSASSPPSNLI